MIKGSWGGILAGCCAGIVNGLLGAGGGMLLVPLLSRLGGFEDKELFSASIAVMAPICMVSLGFAAAAGPLPWAAAMPYLAGSAAGGFLAGRLSGKIPTKWLHRMLGVLILWGGLRYLWN